MTSRFWLLSTLCLLACDGATPQAPLDPPKVVVAVAASPVTAAATLSKALPSLYDLPVMLVDSTGAMRRLDAFRGAPLLITMFYGSCASACPLLTSELKRIERQMPEAVRNQVRVLMVSFDQARDTPEVLARLKSERGMDPSRWTLASANDDDARALAGVLGIRYRKLDNGEFFHSSTIVLLDGEGRPRARVDGLGKDPAPILSALASTS